MLQHLTDRLQAASPLPYYKDLKQLPEEVVVSSCGALVQQLVRRHDGCVELLRLLQIVKQSIDSLIAVHLERPLGTLRHRTVA